MVALLYKAYLNSLLFECPLCMGLEILSFHYKAYFLSCLQAFAWVLLIALVPSKNGSLKRTKTGPTCKRPTRMPYPTWGAFLHMVCETYLSKSTAQMTFLYLFKYVLFPHEPLHIHVQLHSAFSNNKAPKSIFRFPCNCGEKK